MPVGTTLMNLRRERGKTLAEVQASTMIMGRMLSALENERWDELPAEVYVKGYIQNYASFLGVDPVPLVEEYVRDIGTHVERTPLRHIPERTVVKHRLDVHAIPKGAWRAAALAVLVVALLVWGVAALLGRDDSPPPIPPETTATTAPNVGTPADAVGEQGGEDPFGSFELKIAVAEGQSSWVQVRVDSLLAYEGTLPGGEIKEWTVSQEAVVRVGAPASVEVTRNGQPVEIPASTDGIAEVTIAAASE